IRLTSRGRRSTRYRAHVLFKVGAGYTPRPFFFVGFHTGDRRRGGAGAREHSQTDLQVSAGFMGFSYKEYSDSGVLLDREDAWLPGVTGELGYREGPWRISASGSFFGGKADYDGQTQGGVAVNTNTDERLWSAGLRFEGRLEMGAGRGSPALG